MDEKVMDFEANFSVLDRYGTDVTKEDFITNPAIGRDSQIKDLILILLTPEKSAILIGKPGIGKTAIVEGLAYRLQNDDVPDALKGYTIINMKTASLLGTMPSGESKVQKMIDELKTRDKIILFIDEIHMLIGATDSSSLDFANIFKEGLGRGSIKVIGATTTEEYERYILRDKAFTRRFQKIEVPEPNHEETVEIMMGTLPKFEKQTGRKMKYTPFIQERIMDFLVDITSEYKRVFALGSRYPDVCLTLLKQAFSYTVYDNRPYMDIFDVRKAIENSKNIYPDVIKKELPRFDELFNDIILEEKGEKPVEEWRKDGTLTRDEIENGTSADNTDEGEDAGEVPTRPRENEVEEAKEVVAQTPEQLQRLANSKSNIIMEDNRRKKKRPVFNIPTENGKFVELGPANLIAGKKDKINRTGQSKGIDDIILGSDVETMKEQREKIQARNFVVTDEIRPDVNDNFLLGRPIESTLEMGRRQNVPQQVGRYRNGNVRRNQNQQGFMNYDGYGPGPGPGPGQWQGGPPPGQGGPMPNGYGPMPPQNYGPNYGPPNNQNRRPNRMDINNQNFDKYNNYFHQDDNRPVNRDPRDFNNYQGRNKNQNQYPDDSFDVTKKIVQMNNKMKPSKGDGMVSLSDSDNDTLFGYLNKDEPKEESKGFDNSISLNNNYSDNSAQRNNETRPERPRPVYKDDNRKSNNIRSYIENDSERKEEDATAGLDAFPMMNIMKGISNNGVEPVQEETRAEEKKDNNNNNAQEEKNLDFMSNDDLLGGLDSINDSSDFEKMGGNDSIASSQANTPSVDTQLDSIASASDFVNFSTINAQASSDAGSVVNKEKPVIDTSNIQIDLNLESGSKEENFDDFFE